MLRTPFHSFHADHHAKFVDFAGWEMPISYGSIIEEHKQVRTRGGLFDVSHMGRFKISGRHARRLLERALTRRITDMKPMTCRYSLVCDETGGVIDDVIVYKFEEDWLLVVNASNRQTVMDQLKSLVGDMTVKLEDQTTDTAMVALQGPRVMDVLGKFSREIPTLKRYAFCIKNLLILKMIISRTGYTGEDGVEVILPASTGGMAVKLLLNNPSASAEDRQVMKPVGLGARDTLRLEAGMPLYGHELSRQIDPLSADLGFAVTLNKDEMEQGEPFVGQMALKKIAAEGIRIKRVGLKMDGKRTPRQGMKLIVADTVVGQVTSGCLSPTLGHPIAMGYVPVEHSTPGSTIIIDLGSTKVESQVTPLPFYKRPS